MSRKKGRIFSNNVINILDNFDQGQRRITRISKHAALLSSEVSDVDTDENNDPQNESDASSAISDIELRKFSGEHIIQGTITDMEDINVFCEGINLFC